MRVRVNIRIVYQNHVDTVLVPLQLSFDVPFCLPTKPPLSQGEGWGEGELSDCLSKPSGLTTSPKQKLRYSDL